MVCANKYCNRSTQVHFSCCTSGYHPNSGSSAADYKLHPVLLDACINFVLHPDIAQPPNKDTIFLPRKLRRLTVCNFPTYEGSMYSHVRMVDWNPGASSSYSLPLAF